MNFQTSAENSQGQCRRDVTWQFVPDTSSSDRESSVARHSATVYDGQSVMMMTLSKEYLEPRGLDNVNLTFKMNVK